MEERNVTSFPRPVRGRIPNFIGANIAAERLNDLSNEISVFEKKKKEKEVEKELREKRKEAAEKAKKEAQKTNQ